MRRVSKLEANTHLKTRSTLLWQDELLAGAWTQGMRVTGWNTDRCASIDVGYSTSQCRDFL